MNENELEHNEKTIKEIQRVKEDIKKGKYHTLKEAKKRTKI